MQRPKRQCAEKPPEREFRVNQLVVTTKDVGCEKKGVPGLVVAAAPSAETAAALAAVARVQAQLAEAVGAARAAVDQELRALGKDEAMRQELEGVKRKLRGLLEHHVDVAAQQYVTVLFPKFGDLPPDSLLQTASAACFAPCPEGIAHHKGYPDLQAQLKAAAKDLGKRREMPFFRITGSADAADGIYVFMRTERNGYPLWRREDGEAYIYCLSKKDKYAGWWVGPEISGDVNYLFKAGVTERPPESGWKLGAVHAELDGSVRCTVLKTESQKAPVPAAGGELDGMLAKAAEAFGRLGDMVTEEDFVAAGIPAQALPELENADVICVVGKMIFRI